MKKGLRLRNPFINLARPAGFEPTTPWFVGDLGQFVVAGYQRLAALANSLSSHIKAQTGHSQSELVTLFVRSRLRNGGSHSPGI
jgi:hypothetical protein